MKHLILWRTDHNLVPNTKNPKEIIVDTHSPLCINGEEAESVNDI